MPTAHRNGYKIDARLHPASDREAAYPIARFKESPQTPYKDGRVSSEVGVTKYDKALSTINFYHLFVAKGDMLKSIEVDVIIDGVEVSSESVTATQVINRRHTLQTPAYNLSREVGVFCLNIKAHYKDTIDTVYPPSTYQLEFRYRRYEGCPPMPFGPGEYRATTRRRPEERINGRRTRVADDIARHRLEARERSRLPPSLILSRSRRLLEEDVRSLEASQRLNRSMEAEQQTDMRSPTLSIGPGPDRTSSTPPIALHSTTPALVIEERRRRSETPIAPMVPSPNAAEHERAPRQVRILNANNIDAELRGEVNPGFSPSPKTPPADQEDVGHPNRDEEAEHQWLCTQQEGEATVLRRERELLAVQKRKLREEVFKEEERVKVRELEKRLALLKRKAEESVDKLE